MSRLSFRSLTFTILIACLVWSSSIQICIARTGRHWKQSRYATASLSKKKGKSHGQHNYNNGGSKPKPPPPKTTIPSPPPSPNAPPPTPPPQKGYSYGQQSNVFDVLDFGAKGDGEADDTKVNVNFSFSQYAMLKVLNLPIKRNPR